MKSSLAIGVLFLVGSVGSQATLPYFHYTRDVTSQGPNQQNYIVVDREIWQHSRADLADIRLYDDDSENQVPYALREQKGGTSSDEEQVRILNLGTTGNEVQFDLDLGAVSEYDRVRLQLDAKDFVVTAQVEGRNKINDTRGVKLGLSTLYDFTHEKLGSNSVLQLPPSSFRFLHVKLSEGLKANQIKSAFVSNVEDQKASFMSAGECQPSASQQGTTVFNCSVAESVPVDRISFQVNADKVNFRRAMVITDSTGSGLASGEIERIRIIRQGQSVISEKLTLDVSDVKAKQLKITIQNGDDAPLPLESVRPLSIERRIYFDPQGKTLLKLYFGDEKLSAPDYDYAKFFREEKMPVEAQLGPPSPNSAYRGRMDDRPWSERHKAVLWLAMLLAVSVLTILAIRGFKADVKPV